MEKANTAEREISLNCVGLLENEPSEVFGLLFDSSSNNSSSGCKQCLALVVDGCPVSTPASLLSSLFCAEV